MGRSYGAVGVPDDSSGAFLGAGSEGTRDVGVGLGFGSGTGPGGGLDADLDDGLDADLGGGVDTGPGAGLDADRGGGLDTDLGVGLGADLGANLGGGLDTELGAGLDADLGVDSGDTQDVGIDADLGAGLDGNLGDGWGGVPGEEADRGLRREVLDAEAEACPRAVGLAGPEATEARAVRAAELGKTQVQAAYEGRWVSRGARRFPREEDTGRTKFMLAFTRG